MRCTDCGRENRTDARFCAACGHALTLVCGSCQRDLAPDAAFCDGCGSPFSAGSAEVEPKPPDTAARKTVTALFCDLVGSTAFGEKVDAESAREAMARYRTMAQAAIEANGGTVSKFIGDGVMALFGVPEVAEDDAERAVRAGLALQHAFLEIGRHIAQRHDVGVGLRVGINTGEVVIAEEDDDIVGDALNTAARLEAACTPGEVLVGESTWRLTRSIINYAEPLEIAAKGKDDPVAGFEVIEAHEEEDELTTPFVGRDDELARLRAVVEDTIVDRSARMVTVIGAPGVGKTRLARELRGKVDGGIRAHEVRCERAGGATFAPVAELLRAIAGTADSDSAEDIAEALRRVVAPLDDADRVAGLLGGFLGVVEMRSTEEMFFAVRRLFEALGGVEPVMFVVDDIQWAEPLFLDLLEHLAEWVQTVPLVIVALARPEIRESRPVFVEVGRGISAVVSLEGLDSAMTGELAARLLGTDRLPAGLLEKIPESTDGNPLFVRELVRMLVDDGVISDESGSWELVIDLEAVEVPPTVITLLASRVERMAPDERRVLELAAVVGPDFPVGALAAIGDHRNRDELAATLERLRRKELVEPTGTYLGDEPVYRFHHVLIRDAAYRRLLKGARAELHTAVGEWTERTAASLVGEYEVTIANHYEQAHLYRHELDLDDDDTAALGRRAAALFDIAARRALEREDLSAAGSLARRALRCLPDDAASVTDLLLLGCEAMLSLGDVAVARPLVERFAEVAADDPRLGGWLTCFETELIVFTDPGGLAAAEPRVDAAARALGELGDQAGVAKARFVRAVTLFRLGRVGDGEGELDLALSAARAVDDRRRVTAVLGAAPVAALWGPSPVPRAGGRCLDVIRLLRITTGSAAVEATSIRCQAVLEALRGRFDTARDMLDSARSTVEELGLSHGLLEVDFYCGLVELLADDPVAAEPHLREAHAGLGQLGIGAEAGQAAAYLARALLLQGRLDEAEDLIEDSNALAGQNPQTAIVSRSVHAEVLAARGAFDQAIALADEAVRLAAQGDILFDHANAVAALARVRAAAGDVEGAARSAASANALYAEKGATVVVETGRAETGFAESGPKAQSIGRPASSDPDGGALSGDRPALQPGGHVPWNAADRLTRANLADLFGKRLDEFARALSDDAVHEDRRPMLRNTSLGVDEVLAAFGGVAASNLDEAVEVEMETIAVRGERLVLLAVTATAAHEYAFLHIGQISGDDLINRVVMFGIDARIEAVAELGRLFAESEELRTGGDTGSPAEHAWNRASRWAREVERSGIEPSMITEDAMLDDRRPLISVSIGGREAIAELIAGIQEHYATSRYETLAVRGDLLSLAFRSMEYTGDDKTVGYEHLQVTCWTEDGRLAYNSVFEPEQLAEAIEELDRLYLESLEPFEALRFQMAIVDIAQATTAGELDWVLSWLAPDVALIDHRPLGFGSLDRGGYVDFVASLSDSTSERVAALERVFANNQFGSVVRHGLRSETSGGGSVLNRYLTVVLLGAGGLVQRTELFDQADTEAALGCLEEHTAAAGRRLLNRASMTGMYVNAALRPPEPEEAHLFTDGKRLAEILHLIADPDRLANEEHPFGLADRKVIAIRHDRLCLVDVEMADGVRRWSVEELDEDGRLCDWRLFERAELADAVDDFEERYSSISGLGTRADTRFGMATRASDLEMIDELLPDDFVMVDHRPLSYGSLRKADLLELNRIENSRDQQVLVTTETLTLTEQGGVYRLVSMDTQVGAEIETVNSISVLVIRDDQVVAMELFEEDDDEAALARSAELTAADAIQSATERAANRLP